MKILFLVIASENILYNKLKNYWFNIINNNNNNIDVFFLYNNDNINNNYIILNNNITFKEKECYIPGIFNKTINSLKIIDYQKYDFIIRTNLSSYFYIKGLINFLKTVNTSNIYGPIIKICKKYDNIRFIVGFCIIISKNNIKYILNNLKNLENKFKYKFKKYPDDVLFGLIFKELNIKMVEIKNNFINTLEISKIFPDKLHLLDNKFIIRNRYYYFINGKADFEKRLKYEIPNIKLITNYI